MTPAVNLVAVGVHSKDQDHDASHDASSHGAHGGTFNHVQCDHLVAFGKVNKQMSCVRVSQVQWQEQGWGEMGRNRVGQGLGEEQRSCFKPNSSKCTRMWE